MTHLRDEPTLDKRSVVAGVLLSIPLWGLILAAIFSVVVRMILFALAVVLIAAKVPEDLSLLSRTMLIGALGLIILGIVLAIDRWF